VLSAHHRLTSPTQFREVVRRGRRSGSPLLVAHLLTTTPAAVAADTSPGPRVGLVVSKAVGPAVTRNLVKRRLRHLARERLDRLPVGALLVLRALPASAGASYADLGAAFDRCLDTLTAAESRVPAGRRA
jgi:ribonuclease P protein component